MTWGASSEYAERATLITTLSELRSWIEGHHHRHYRKEPGCVCGWADDMWASMTFEEHLEVAAIEDLGELLPSDDYGPTGRLSWYSLCNALRNDLHLQEAAIDAEAQRRAAMMSGYHQSALGLLRELQPALGRSRAERFIKLLRAGEWRQVSLKLCEILVSESVPVSHAQYGCLTSFLYVTGVSLSDLEQVELKEGLNLVD